MKDKNNNQNDTEYIRMNGNVNDDSLYCPCEYGICSECCQNEK